MKVQMFWEGELSLYEQAGMLSFLRQGFEVDLYSFDAGLKPPAGVRLRDAAELMDPALRGAYRQGNVEACPLALSDLFRYHLLAQHGGLWADTDILCLRPAADYAALQADLGERLLVARESEQQLNGAVIMAAAGSPASERLLAEALALGHAQDAWGAYGPLHITRFARAHPDWVEVLPGPSFYPLHYIDFALALLPEAAAECARRAEGSYGFHLWNKFYREYCIPQNQLPPAGSYLHGLMAPLLPQDLTVLPAPSLRRLVRGTNALNRLDQLKSTLAERLTAMIQSI